MADDHDPPHAEQRRAALLRVAEKLDKLVRLGPAQHVGERLLHHPHEHAARRLVKLEDHVADKAVAHDHVDPALLALTRQDVPALDVADVVDARRLLEELVRFLQDRKSTRLNSSHSQISYAVFCLKKKKTVQASFR